MNYTSYERLKVALQHKEPDRIPFDLGGTLVSCLNIKTLRALRAHLGLLEGSAVPDKVTQSALPEQDVGETLKTDVKNVGPYPPSKPGLAKGLGLQGHHDRLIDEFGIGWQMPVEGGHYYDLYLHPFANAETVHDIESYPWPDPLDPARYVNLKERVDQAVLQDKKGVFLERMSSGMWEHAIWMTGYEKFFMNMIENEKVVHATMSKILEIKMAYWGRVLDEVTDHTVVISCADDLGTQRGLMVSLDMYKRLIWPYHRDLFQFLKKKARTDIYIFFHNDGAIYETLPLLIEAGIDIINPWQVNCAGMDDTAKFKREFGEDLTVWGGSCDMQNVLPFGTAQQVRDETRRRIEDLAPGGGFVFAPIHVIQSGVPIENIMAWWETLQEYGVY